jgi:hypothetical protein
MLNHQKKTELIANIKTHEICQLVNSQIYKQIYKTQTLLGTENNPLYIGRKSVLVRSRVINRFLLGSACWVIDFSE